MDREQKKNPGNLKLWDLKEYFHCLQSYWISISALNIESELMLNTGSAPVP